MNKKIIDLVKKISDERKKDKKYYGNGNIYLVQVRDERVVNPEYTYVDVERLYLNGVDIEGEYPTLDDIKNGYLRDALEEYEDGFISQIENCATLEEVAELLNDGSYYSVEIIYLQYYWETVAYFATEKDAKEYQSYQAHNLGVNRIYNSSQGYANRGLLAQLLQLLDEEEFIEED